MEFYFSIELRFYVIEIIRHQLKTILPQIIFDFSTAITGRVLDNRRIVTITCTVFLKFICKGFSQSALIMLMYIVNIEKRILLELVFQILYEKVPVSGTEGQTGSTVIILF